MQAVVETGSDPKGMAKVIRGLNFQSPKMDLEFLEAVFKKCIPEERLKEESSLSSIPKWLAAMAVEEKKDTSEPMATEEGAEKSPAQKRAEQKKEALEKLNAEMGSLLNEDSDFAERSTYVMLLVQEGLMLRGHMQLAAECVESLLKYLDNFPNSLTLHALLARAQSNHCLVAEKLGKFQGLRSELLKAYRTAVLRHNTSSQATLCNLILRNYLLAKEFDLASIFISKSKFPEGAVGADSARFAFYVGKMKMHQQDYSKAHQELRKALRKAPQDPTVAVGFKEMAWKLLFVVEMLLGEVPRRQQFAQKEFGDAFEPYLAITQAVRTGSAQHFEEVFKKHSAVFKKDETYTLIQRLTANVMRTGLRKMNAAYSRISLGDIAAKLAVNPTDIELMVAKVIAHNVMQATINNADKCVESKMSANHYVTKDPAEFFHKRIDNCLRLHADCVRALTYPAVQTKPKTDDSNSKDSVEIDDDNLDDSHMNVL